MSLLSRRLSWLRVYRCSMKMVFFAFLIFWSVDIFAAKRTLAISESVYKEMQKAQLLGEEKRYREAENVLNALFERRLNQYEIAQTHSTFGGLYYQQGEYEKSYESFKKVVQYKDIPDGLYQLTLKTLSQLALVNDKYAEARSYVNELLSLVEDPDAHLYVLLAQTYLSANDYRKALEPLTKAIDMERAEGKKIRENWLLMANSIYYSLEMFSEMRNILKELAENYTKTQYLINLAAIYGQMGDTAEQLLILEPLYEKGEIGRESLLLNLANLYMLHGVPVKSARLLSRAMSRGQIKDNQQNYEMLAQSWQLSQEIERAIVPLKRASELSTDGKLNLRLAQLYFFLYDWREAEKELKTALKKGKLDDQGNGRLLLGMSQFNQKKYSAAITSFNLAKGHPATSSLAEQWVAYVRSERDKQELVK